MIDRYWRAYFDDVVQFADVFVVEGDAAPRPIRLRAVSMNKDLAAQARVLGRLALCFYRSNDLFVLSLGYQALAKTAFGVFQIRIANPE